MCERERANVFFLMYAALYVKKKKMYSHLQFCSLHLF